jgi:hypothetical protein
MIGSQKQIEWATKIQQQFIGDVRTWHANNAKAAEKASQLAQWDAAIADVVAQAEARQDAAWWIDNRHETSVGGRGKIIREMYTAAVAKVSK